MFEAITGNSQVVSVMRRWAESGKPNHAYIISGQAGSGKLELASSFTRMLLCQGNRDVDCRCVPCRTLETGNHPDVVFVCPSKAKSIGVEDIREQVVTAVEIKPYSSNYKVFIIENADLMTVAAQNALLKSLEEPPPYGVFLLLAENADTLLPTVLSRCVVLKMNAVPIEKRVQEEEFIALRGELLGLIEQIEAAAGQKDIVGLLAAAVKIGEYKDNIDKVLDVLCLFYRDVAVYCETRNEAMLIQRGIAEAIKAVADGSRGTQCVPVKRAEAIHTARQRLKRNANFQLTMEVMMLDFM